MRRRLLAEVPVGAEIITVWEADGLREKESAEGLWVWSRMEIMVDSRCTGRSRWVVVFHELVHAISDMYALKVDRETVCNALGHGLTQALGRWLGEPPECVPAEPEENRELTRVISVETNRELMDKLGQRPEEET